MKHARKTAFLLLLAVIAALLGGAAAMQGRSQERYQVAMIVKSSESSFFKSVFAGAGAAATEYNIALTTAGAQSEEDYESQNEMIRDAVKNGADALVVSAVDYEKNAEAIDWAAGKGVPSVIIDSDVNSSTVKRQDGWRPELFWRAQKESCGSALSILTSTRLTARRESWDFGRRPGRTAG